MIKYINLSQNSYFLRFLIIIIIKLFADDDSWYFLLCFVHKMFFILTLNFYLYVGLKYCEYRNQFQLPIILIYRTINHYWRTRNAKIIFHYFPCTTQSVGFINGFLCTKGYLDFYQFILHGLVFIYTITSRSFAPRGNLKKNKYFWCCQFYVK